MQIPEDVIDDICCAAFEGGISYWSDQVKVIESTVPEGASIHFAENAISNGASVEIFDIDTDESYILTPEGFEKGLQLYVDSLELDPEEPILDCGDIDADEADKIIQYALFGEILFS